MRAWVQGDGVTDRLKGFVVALDHDMREDDAELVLNAIRMIKCVASVEPIKVGYDDHMNRDKVRCELQEKLREALK